MNSPLEQDFDGFDFPAKNKIRTEESDSELPIIEEPINITKPLECGSEDLPQCEVCSQQFLTKKELRSHITLHLGQPRIILKRCTNLQNVKKKEKNTYCLSQEKKGSLKLTLKKQNHRNFAVISRDLDLDTNKTRFEEVAGGKESDDHPVEKENEEQDEAQQYNNVINNENSKYQDDQYNNNDEENFTDDNGRPSMEINEGDSGVGSDMANTCEKEDQIVDDLQSNDQPEDETSHIVESENPEESDPLEATCRETIENLKKLGEHSSSIREDMSPRSGNKSPDESSEIINSRVEEENVLQLLAKNSAIEIRAPERLKVNKNIEKSQSTLSIDWSQLSEDSADKNDNNSRNDNNEISKDIGDNNSDPNVLLHSLLSEHNRKEDEERSPSRSSPVETEYVPLEKLAETVNKCRVCNEKFNDITQLDEHKSQAGHYQCNVPDCSTLVFSTLMEVSVHKSQAHGASLSPSISITPTHVAQSSPRLRENSPSMSHSNSPHLANHSPHSVNVEPINPLQISRTSPLTHQTHSPTFNSQQQIIPPVNFEQLPAPVQQLAQQVQRMALPQPQMPSSLQPGSNTIIHGANYFVPPQGRPMYRIAGPQGMQYPAHLAHLYGGPPQYGAPPYPQYPAPPQMHPSQMPQQIPRGRYPTMIPTTRAPRAPPPAPPQAPVPRQRLKRPIQPTQPSQRSDLNTVAKQRRMDLLLPDRNEDADCHVIAQQKRNDGVPVIQNVQGATTSQPTSRSDSTIHLTDSITLSVRQPGSAPAQVQNSGAASAKKPDAKAVANVLAARGITVTPTANKNKTAEQQKQQSTSAQPQQQQQRTTGRTSPPVNVTALNLNSAISIIPASSQRKQAQQQEQQQFAVPQNKQNKPTQPEVERPPRPPTVDLTQDTPTPTPVLPPARRGRPPRAALMCQICDKSFQNQEMLVQHMATHRTSNKLLHKCNLCTAQYPTAQDLLLHKQNYHKDDSISTNGIELAIPVVDLKSPQTLNRLTSLGIQSYIPLSQLSAQTNGYFGLPIITIDSPRNPNSYNLAALGATSILSLGPLKYLSNR
ncbi:histone acetyltransferase KAT6A-like isoform X2 [Chelonus insularis]|nr:histone acetyltransferase KAT6A-like isoform X2 [Chelonus insularis]